MHLVGCTWQALEAWRKLTGKLFDREGKIALNITPEHVIIPEPNYCICDFLLGRRWRRGAS